MWHNPNWSKPPLRFVIIVFIPFFLVIGRCQGQGQRILTPQFQQPGGFPAPRPLQPPSPLQFGSQNQGSPPFQPGQAQFQQGQTQFQPGQPQFQPGQPQFQPGQQQFQPGQQQFQPGQQQFQPGQPQFQPGQGSFQPGQVQFPLGEPQQRFQMIQQLPPGVSNRSSFNDPGIPQSAVQLSSIVNLGPQTNSRGLSMFRSWEIMSHFLPTLRTHSPDYVLTLQPDLFKGIPTINISMELQGSLNPQILKAIVTQSSGMLVSQKSLIVAKLVSRLGNPATIHMILGTENPGELIAFLNPRLVRKNIGVFIRAIGEFTSIRSETNILKVRLLPTSFLSIMLTTLLGETPLSIQSLSSRTIGNGDLISSSLMGMTCEQLLKVRHDEVVPILGIFRTQLVGMRKVAGNLNYPVNLRNCSVEAVLAHLEMKAGDNGTNVLSRLEGKEIDVLGGELFTGVPTEALERIPVDLRRQILIEIGQLEIFDLLSLAPVSTLQWYGKTLLTDLTSGPVAQDQSGSPQPLAPAPPGSLDIQSLLKVGNLFCYANILNANASKESIRQLLTTKMSPGAKTCCLDSVGQMDWSTALKKTFGSDPSLWKSEELGLVGDLLVALSRDDIAKIPVGEIRKIISGLLQTSGLNFPMNIQQIHGPIPFARACSVLLGDDNEGWLDSFKALMRKYALGAELMVDSMQGAQKVMDNNNANKNNPNNNGNNNNANSRRFVRETPQRNDYVDVDRRFPRTFAEESLRYEGHQQRYQRQAPMVMTPPPFVQVNRAPPAQGQSMRQPPTPMGTVPPPQRLPPISAFQQMRPVQAPLQPILQPVPPQRIPQQFQALQGPIQMQRQPQLMTPVAGAQGQVMLPPQRQPVSPSRLVVPLNTQQQQHGTIKNPGLPVTPAPTVTSTGKLADERTRSLSSDPEVKLTCLGVKAAGPAAIGLQISDFETLEREDLRACIEAIGFVDWGEDMQRQLLLLYKQKLNLTTRPLTTLNLLELGSLVTGLSTAGQESSVNGLFNSGKVVEGHDKFSPFDVSSIDMSVPESLDSVAILGTGIKNPELLKAIAEKFSQDNGLFKPKDGNSQRFGLRATVWSLGNIICGFDDDVLKTILDSRSSLFLEVSPILGRLEGCDGETLSRLAHYAVQPSNYGDPKTWTPEDVDTLGVIVAGLTPEARASIPPMSLAASHPLATAALTTLQARSLTPTAPEPPQIHDADEVKEILAEPTNEPNGTSSGKSEERNVNGTQSPTGNITTSVNNTTPVPTPNTTHPVGVEVLEVEIVHDHEDADTSSAEKNLVKSMNVVWPVVILLVMTVYHR